MVLCCDVEFELVGCTNVERLDGARARSPLKAHVVNLPLKVQRKLQAPRHS